MIIELKSLTEKAFYSYADNIWGGIDKVDKIDKCYYLALDSFTREGIFADILRKELQIEYMKGLFAFKNEDDLLMRTNHLLNTDNTLISTILNNICLLYNEPVQRSITNDWFIKLQYDDFLNKVHKLGKFNCNILAFVGWDKQEGIKLQTLTKGYYNWIDLGDDNWELWIAHVKEVKQKKYIDSPKDLTNNYNWNFHVWTKDNYKLCDQNGKTIGDVKPNPYKVIPFVEVDFSDFNRYDYIDSSGGMYGLLLKQLKSNMIDYSTTVSVAYSNTTFMWLDNIKIQDKSAFGLGKVIETITEDNDPDKQIEFIQAPANYSEASIYKVDSDKQTLKEYGIPNGQVNESGLMSGEALKIDRIRLEEIRKGDIKVMEYYEKKISAMIDIVSRVHGQPTNFGEYTITYNSLDYEGDAKAKYDLIKEKLINNDISFYDYLRDLGYIGDNAELMETYKKILEINNEFSRIATTAGRSSLSTEADEQSTGDIQEDINEPRTDNGVTEGTTNENEENRG